MKNLIAFVVVACLGLPLMGAEFVVVAGKDKPAKKLPKGPAKCECKPGECKCCEGCSCGGKAKHKAKSKAKKKVVYIRSAGGSC